MIALIGTFAVLAFFFCVIVGLGALAFVAEQAACDAMADEAQHG